MRLLSCVTLYASITTTLGAQDAIISARRARAVLERGIIAMGGLPALQLVNDVSRRLHGIRTDMGQGTSPGLPSNNHPRMTVVNDIRGTRFMRDLSDTIVGGQPLHFRLCLTTTNGQSANLVVGTVFPVPLASLRNSLFSQGRRWPESVLQIAWNRPEALRYVDENRITFADPTGTQVGLTFDGASGRLTAIDWVYDDAIKGDALSEVLLDDWRPAGDVLLPYRYTERTAGNVLQTLTASEIVVNGGVPDSLFAPPAGLTAAASDGGPAEQLAEGIFLLRGGYTGIAVVYDDYVLVLEAGGSSGSAAGHLAEIERVAPRKPVRYVVSTHFHHDHLSGVRPYIAAGATIVTTAHAAPVIREAARATHVLRPDTLSRAPREPRIEIVTDHRTFGEGAKRLELYQIGPNPHAAQMLIAYLPGLRLLFEADMLDLTDGRPTPGGADTRHLAATVQRLGIDVQRIVAVHGGMGSVAQLEQAVSVQPQ